MVIGGDLIDLSGSTRRRDIVEVLTEAIISNRIKPGERLNESEIARQLGISRAPIREALQSLQQRGLVTSNPRRGMFVVELKEADKQKINSVRLVLEAESLRLCRRYLAVPGENRLKKILKEMSRCASGPADQQQWRLDLEFHRTLWSLSGNELLEKTLINLTAPLFTHASVAVLDKAQREKVVASHAEILEYIQGRSPCEAEELLLRHYQLGWSNPGRYSRYQADSA